MTKILENWFFKLILIGLSINVVLSIKLESMSTNRPRQTKYTMKPTSPTGTATPSTTSTYRVNATNGATCILIKTDGLLSITYRDKYNEDKEADSFMPDNVDVSGECDEDESSITMSWKGFTLLINFEKTPGGERWYVNNVEVSYSSSNKIFEHIDRPGLDVKLSTPVHNTLLFPTPVGKSYSCQEEIIVTMYAQDSSDKSGHLAKLYLRDLRMQAFMYKVASSFGPPYQCSATGSSRVSESTPLIVGSTLAFTVVGTVVGYGLWRYFKVKKVQYGTMA